MDAVDRSAIKVAVDIGGTFTDLVLLAGGRVAASAKVLTTPSDPSEAAVEGLELLLAGFDPVRVTEVVHGTTLVTNSLIERKGARTALLTTEGFRDVLASGREQRYALYDLFLELPEPLVPRRRRFGVPERILADGSIDTPLNVEKVRSLATVLRTDGVEAVAVCLLHSYRNSVHEEEIRTVLRDELPGVAVSLSSDVSPEVGEHQRTSTTVANAYVLPVVDRYLEVLQERIADAGITAPLHIMFSTGGLTTVDTARRLPVRMLESGPAAGVLGAGFFGSAAGHTELLAFDMGGTTAKAALLEGGVPLLASEHEVARVYRFTKGSGLPIRTPVIDLIEIGAGGGSIARVGTFRLPEVGPDSAGADPGPACYGLGGTDPTVTDADLLLGYLNPDFFLGGQMALDAGAAHSAVERLAAGIDLSVEEASSAIHRVVNENMAAAARMHAVERGRDLRRYTLVATGGAGPVHAWDVAKALAIRKVMFPPRAGVASAFGMHAAPAAFEFARSLPGTIEDVDWSVVRDAVNTMVGDGMSRLISTGVEPDSVTTTLSADVRYEGQGQAITVALGSHAADLAAELVSERFDEAYVGLYGSRPAGVETEVLTWRARMAAPHPVPDVRPEFGTGPTPVKGTRQMWFTEASGFVDGEVFDRYLLHPEMKITGPAVVEERESTVVVGPGATAVVDAVGNLEMTLGD